MDFFKVVKVELISHNIPDDIIGLVNEYLYCCHDGECSCTLHGAVEFVPDVNQIIILADIFGDIMNNCKGFYCQSHHEEICQSYVDALDDSHSSSFLGGYPESDTDFAVSFSVSESSDDED